MDIGSLLSLSAAGPRMARLRQHCLLGDHLMVELDEADLWFRPRSTHVGRSGELFFDYVYESEDRELARLEIDLGPGTAHLADLCDHLKAVAGPADAYRRWKHVISRLGEGDARSTGADRHVDIHLSDHLPFVAARRASHPAPVIDALLCRDRALAAEAFEDALLGQPRAPTAGSENIGQGAAG